MKAPVDHQCRVLGTPWSGIHCTAIDSGRHYGRHWHTTYGFGLLEHGAQTSASGRGSVDAYAGDVITTNPGEVHDGRPLGGPTRRWRMVYVDPGVVASLNGAVALTRPVFQDPLLSRALRQLFARLAHWRDRHGASDTDRLACEESLARVCTLLLDRHSTAAPERETAADLAQVRDRLADEMLEAPSLAELAAMAGLSKYQLLRRFEKAYGVPPHSWLLLQRAERARALIRGGASLAHTAAACGFADQSHLTRIFVRQFGFTPGAWRKASLQ